MNRPVTRFVRDAGEYKTTHTAFAEFIWPDASGATSALRIWPRILQQPSKDAPLARTFSAKGILDLRADPTPGNVFKEKPAGIN